MMRFTNSAADSGRIALWAVPVRKRAGVSYLASRSDAPFTLRREADT